MLSLLMAGSAAAAYNPAGALKYAALWWNSTNHDCSTAYDACSPWSYWGEEACGYQSHGGDCGEVGVGKLLD